METMTIDEFLSVSELVRITAESESAWRKRLARKELPHVKLGANVRVRRSDFEAWVEHRMVRVGESAEVGT